MANKYNLPEAIQYESKIKEIIISPLYFNNINGVENCCRYFIKFIEVKEKEDIITKFLFFKKHIKVITEEQKIVPFSFKTLKCAEDFAKYLPNIKICGDRLFYKFEKFNKQLIYETYKIYIDELIEPVFIKFTKECEKSNIIERTNNVIDFYINDLDKKFMNDRQGNFYDFRELVVDYFFRIPSYTIKPEYLEESEMIPTDSYETISEIKDFESKTVHKYVLLENI